MGCLNNPNRKLAKVRARNALKPAGVLKNVPIKTGKRSKGVSLTAQAQARVKVIPDVQEAIMTVLTAGPDSEEARNVIVNQHQLQALKSNPHANTALTKKQMKKLRRRAFSSGLLTPSLMEI